MNASYNQRQQQPQQREEIVDKLHGALASLRKERDHLHRSKELAIERLRLAREERVTVEKTVSSMENTYERLKASMDGSTKGSSSNRKNAVNDDITTLQGEVERLGREARFQHAELVDKREKMSQLKTRINEEESTRAGYLRLAHDGLRNRREKISLKNLKVQRNHRYDDNNNDDETVEKMRKFLDDSEGIASFSKLHRLIEKKANDVVAELSISQDDSESLTRRIAGYTGGLDYGLRASTELDATHINMEQ